MRRILIGFGTPLGHYLSSHQAYANCYTYRQSICGVPRCGEAVIIMPASTRFSSNALGPLKAALIATAAKAADRLVLISSIEVYSRKGLPLDEGVYPLGMPGKASLPPFEREILDCAAPSQILRLPDVFGLSLKKGSMRCLLEKNGSQINRVAIHQLYPVARLESDIAAAREIDAAIVNLVPEPLAMSQVLAKFFPSETGHVLTPAPYSRIRTRYAGHFGGAGAYIMSASEVLEAIGRYIQAGRDALPGAKKSPRLPAARDLAGAAA